MKNFSSRTRENSLRNSKTGWWKPPLFLLGVFLALVLVREVLTTLASAITAPVFFVRHYIETSSDTVPSFFRSQRELLEQIESLKTELEAERGRDALYALVKEENEALRNLLISATGTPEVLAGVVARPPHTPYDTVILDRGQDAGIVEGAPVYYGKGMVLGTVQAVSSGTSLVKLLSAPGSEATVYVFGPDIFTTARGEGGGVIRVSVPQGLIVSEGDLVVLPSLRSGVLGYVDHIRGEATEPEQYAYVLLDVPLQSLHMVSVGTSPLVPASFSDAAASVASIRETLFSVPVPEEYLASTTAESGTTTP